MIAPSLEVQDEVLVEWDADHQLFKDKVCEKIERSNSKISIIFRSREIFEKDTWGDVGIQMAAVVYAQLERANGGKLPIVDRDGCLGKILDESSNIAGFIKIHLYSYLNRHIGRYTWTAFYMEAKKLNLLAPNEINGILMPSLIIVRTLEFQEEIDTGLRLPSN